jgi:hypothetical protein
MPTRSSARALPALLAAILVACGGEQAGSAQSTPFDGSAALAMVKTQLDFGARIPNTPPHVKTGDWILARLAATADTAYAQPFTQVSAKGDTLRLRNFIGRFRPAAKDRVLYLAHWDTRPISDDASVPMAQRNVPVPGANDGASGVALLLHLAELLKKTPPSVGVDLVFVDGEDYGEFSSDTDVLLGSKYFATHLPSADYKPLFGVLFDMIGDADLAIYQEGNSIEKAPEIVARVWAAAKDLGHSDVFMDQGKYTVTDDHIPLLKAGLRVIDVIDLDYPAHHTPNDTYDKVSAKSLKAVGDVAYSLVR